MIFTMALSLHCIHFKGYNEYKKLCVDFPNEGHHVRYGIVLAWHGK